MRDKANSALSPDLTAWHFLSRTTFGPRPQDVEKVKRVGVEALLNEQLRPGNIDDSDVERKIAGLPTLALSPAELMEDYPAPKQQAKIQARQERMEGQPPGAPNQESMMARPAPNEMAPGMQAEGPRQVLMELAREQLWRAAFSQRQLQEVMVHFWMNHFNIYAEKGVDKWLLTSFEQDAIRPNALGNFSQLLTATAQSPAMLFYLDNWLSVGPNSQAANGPADGRPRPVAFGRSGGAAALRPNGKPAQRERRGLNENYGRELMELHTLGVDGGYTQHDVREVARCFTGWTIDHPQQGGGFIFRPRFHDYGEKVVLGHKISGRGGVEDGMQVLAILAGHPSTAHFISTKLCRHFVADQPSASLVERTAQTFTRSQGDIPSILKTILTSPEFNSPAAFRAKVKSPFDLVASSLRTLGAQTDGGQPLMGMIMRMGQPFFQYQAPTGYPDRASNWINSGTLLARMNFSMALAANRIRGTQLDLEALTPSEDSGEVWDHLVRRTLGGSVSAQTEAAVRKSLDGLNGAGGGNPRNFPRTTLMAALLLGSPEFQRR